MSVPWKEILFAACEQSEHDKCEKEHQGTYLDFVCSCGCHRKNAGDKLISDLQKEGLI